MEENWQDRDQLELDVAKKFKLWDDSKGRDLSLLFDPTIWAYAFLKGPDSNPLELYGFQDLLINDMSRFVSCAASNQVGKTLAMEVKALHHAIHINNASVLIISKSEQQATRVLDEMKWMLKKSKISFKDVKGEIENRTELHIIGPDGISVSRIVILPPTTSVLGYPATLEILDEVAFWEMRIKGIEGQIEYYQQVLEPRTNATKSWKNEHFTIGQIVMISNPWGKLGILWKCHDEDDRYNCYQYCWLANPTNTIEEYKYQEKLYPADRFDSVYAARFSSGAGGFITADDWKRCSVDESFNMPISETIFLGGDYAGEDTKSRDVDLTVMHGVYVVKYENAPAKVRLCYENVFPKRIKKARVYDEIRRIKEQYNLGLYAYDKVGVGDSVKNDLIDKDILSPHQIESLTYSLPNKSEVYYNLKHLFEQGRLEIPKGRFEKLRDELFSLKFEKTPGGYIKIHHASEKAGDDRADSFANACWAAIRLLKGEVSIGFVETDSQKSKMEYVKRVVCLRCEEDWDYIDEEECIFCGADKKYIADYRTHKPIN